MQTEYLYCLVVRDLVSRLVVLRRLLLLRGHDLGDSLNEGRFLGLLLYLRCLCLFVQFCLTRGGFNIDRVGKWGGGRGLDMGDLRLYLLRKQCQVQ